MLPLEVPQLGRAFFRRCITQLLLDIGQRLGVVTTVLSGGGGGLIAASGNCLFDVGVASRSLGGARAAAVRTDFPAGDFRVVRGGPAEGGVLLRLFGVRRE